MRANGYTLLEVVMTTVLLSIVVAIMAVLLDYSMRSMQRETASSNFSFQANSTCEILQRELRDAHYRMVYRYHRGHGHSHAYGLSKERPDQGECIEYAKSLGITPNGDILWSTDPHLPPEKRIAYYVRFQHVGEIEEIQVDRDLNGDCDKLDSFELGYLEQAQGSPGPQNDAVPEELPWKKLVEIPVLYAASPEDPVLNQNYPMFEIKKDLAGKPVQVVLKLLFYDPNRKAALWIELTTSAFNM